MNLTHIVQLWLSGAAVQLIAVGIYLRSYRHVLRQVSRVESEWVIPAILPVGGLALWGLGMFDYGRTYGYRQAFEWLWWQPVGAILGFLIGQRFSRWHRARKSASA